MTKQKQKVWTDLAWKKYFEGKKIASKVKTEDKIYEDYIESLTPKVEWTKNDEANYQHNILQ